MNFVLPVPIGAELLLHAFILFVLSREIFIGAKLSRMDGGGDPETPEIVERGLIMMYFVAAVFPVAGWFSLVALLGAVGIATGIGQYFPSVKVKAMTAETVDFLVRLFFKADPRTALRFENIRGMEPAALSWHDHAALSEAMKEYGLAKLVWRNRFGLFVRGTLVGLPAAIVAIWFEAYAAGGVLMLTGVGDSAAYAAGWHLYKNTESGEWIKGAIRTSIALMALILSVLSVTA